jgi:hypothetical protein
MTAFSVFAQKNVYPELPHPLCQLGWVVLEELPASGTVRPVLPFLSGEDPGLPERRQVTGLNALGVPAPKLSAAGRLTRSSPRS